MKGSGTEAQTVIRRRGDHTGRAVPVAVPADSAAVRRLLVRVLAGDDVTGSMLPSARRLQWEYLAAVLRLCGGNASAAATLVGMHRRTFQRILFDKRAPAIRGGR